MFHSCEDTNSGPVNGESFLKIIYFIRTRELKAKVEVKRKTIINVN